MGLLARQERGDGVVDELAHYLAKTQPGLRGFTRRNLFRMRQFYECYRQHEIVSPLVTQLPWTHHLLILSHSKREEEREFYIRTAIRERWSKRELERQLRAGLFERTILHPPKVSPLVRQLHPEAVNLFKDAYALSRSLSPAMIAEYETQLPDKKLLRAKLHEFYQLLAPPDDDDFDPPPIATKRKGKRGTA